MKAKRLIASLISVAMMIGALPGLVSADGGYTVTVEPGITNEISVLDPHEFVVNDTVYVRLDTSEQETVMPGATLQYAYYGDDNSIKTVPLDLNSWSFQVPYNIRPGGGNISLACYYPINVDSNNKCASVSVSYCDMVTADSDIEISSQLCPGGGTVRVVASPLDGYHIDGIDYTYTLNGVDHTESAVRKEFDSRVYYEFTMPHAPTTLNVLAATEGYRSTYYINADRRIDYKDARIIDGSFTSLSNGWYVVTGNIVCSDRFDVTGDDVNIILEDGASLSATSGIAVNNDHTVNIWGQSNNYGTLTANGTTTGNAAIGGSSRCNAGNINIYGGTVIATGASEGAGIGTGHTADSDVCSSTINIYGGNVTATGGYQGAGIGSGHNTSSHVQIRVNILGGHVTAVSGGSPSAHPNSVDAIGSGFSEYFINSEIVLDSTKDPDISINATRYTVSSDSMHHQTLELIGSFIDESGNTYTGSLTNASGINGKTITAAGIVPIFRGHSLTVGGEIGVNFFVDFHDVSPDADPQNVTMDFTVNGVTTTVDLNPAFTNEDGYYGFTCYVNSSQMADTITAVLHYGDNGRIQNTYSVAEYLDYVLRHQATGGYDQKTIAFVKALQFFGYYIQPYLAHRNTWVVGTDHAQMYTTSTQRYDTSDLNAIYSAFGTGNTYYVPTIDGRNADVGISYGLRLESTTTLRVFFEPRVAGGFQAPISVSVDGSSADYTVESDGRVRVDIAGITPKNLGDGHTIIFNCGSYSITIIDLSAMSFVRSVMDRNGSSSYRDNTEAQYAMCSIYYYYQAALNM